MDVSCCSLPGASHTRNRRLLLTFAGHHFKYQCFSTSSSTVLFFQVAQSEIAAMSRSRPHLSSLGTGTFSQFHFGYHWVLPGSSSKAAWGVFLLWNALNHFVGGRPALLLERRSAGAQLYPYPKKLSLKLSRY